jgi:galactonate dehydratase
MRITGVEILYAGAGWRNLSFLKVTTDADLVGWSEFPESSIGYALTPLIRHLGPAVVGRDPRNVQKVVEDLSRSTRGVSTGAVARAIGAIENALVDIKAKALGIPVHEMLGGALRDTLRLYWSHCGSHHVTHAADLGVEQIRSLDDVKALGRQVRKSGYHALKTNLMMFEGGKATLYRPGFAGGAGDPDRNPVLATIRAAVEQMTAFREGAGSDIGLMLDVNFNFRTEGFLRMARALEPLDLEWLETDSFDATSLAQVRRGAAVPIASGEALTGRRQLRPFLEEQAVDIVVIDVMWNGILESMRMAALADAFEVNVACHNFCGPIATLINAHFGAAVPNFRVMEMDAVQVPWTNDLVTLAPAVERGTLTVPNAPGWGAEVDEESLRAHPAT